MILQLRLEIRYFSALREVSKWLFCGAIEIGVVIYYDSWRILTTWCRQNQSLGKIWTIFYFFKYAAKVSIICGSLGSTSYQKEFVIIINPIKMEYTYFDNGKIRWVAKCICFLNIVHNSCPILKIRVQLIYVWQNVICQLHFGTHQQLDSLKMLAGSDIDLSL